MYSTVFSGTSRKMESTKKIMVSHLKVEMPYQCLRQLLMEITPGLTTCNVVLNQDKTANVGYGFASYNTVELAESACAILDGMPLRGKTLRA